MGAPRSRAMTTANKVTILRILLVPFFVTQLLYYGSTGNETYRLLALMAFFAASILDGVDGYIARRYNQKSALGAILDPLADKLLLVSAIILLTINLGGFLTPIRLWLTATIVGRDFIVLLGVGAIYITAGKVTVRPRITGKIATVLQMMVVLWILLKWNRCVLPYWVAGAGFFTAISGIGYLFDGIRQLSDTPASSPTPKPPV